MTVLAPVLVYPAITLSNFVYIDPDLLMNSVRVRVSIVVCSLSIIAVCPILIRGFFSLSHSLVNTVFFPWNPICFNVYL